MTKDYYVSLCQRKIRKTEKRIELCKKHLNPAVETAIKQQDMENKMREQQMMEGVKYYLRHRAGFRATTTRANNTKCHICSGISKTQRLSKRNRLIIKYRP